MFRTALLALALFTMPATAEEARLCPLTEDQSSCSRILACIGDHGRWFHGRAFGRGKGTLSGVMSDGVTCQGSWVERNLLGLGQADVTCEDGSKGTVIYTYQDRYTGTAHGQGRFENGVSIEAWTGQNVLGYLDEQTGVSLTLPCAAGDLLIS